MFTRWVAVYSCLLLGGAGIFAGSPNAQKDEPTIKSSGCVTEGVEADCLVLKGFKDKKTYSLHFPNKKPGLDTAISFEGADGGVDTCNQGAVVNVAKWTPLKMKCPVPEKTPSK
jgi:hypothetical protein